MKGKLLSLLPNDLTESAASQTGDSMGWRLLLMMFFFLLIASLSLSLHRSFGSSISLQPPIPGMNWQAQRINKQLTRARIRFTLSVR